VVDSCQRSADARLSLAASIADVPSLLGAIDCGGASDDDCDEMEGRIDRNKFDVLLDKASLSIKSSIAFAKLLTEEESAQHLISLVSF
jgi:hypothetical protein